VRRIPTCIFVSLSGKDRKLLGEACRPVYSKRPYFARVL
jgi:hypothetical protein